MMKKNYLILLLVAFATIVFAGIVQADPGSTANDVGVFTNIEYTIIQISDAALNVDLVVDANVATYKFEMNADPLLFNSKKGSTGIQAMPGCKVNWLEIADQNYRDEYLKQMVIIKPEIIRKHCIKLE